VERDVQWAGEAPASAMHEHYAWGDILLHTSLHEAQPVVLAEAAAAGLLVAGSRTGLLADLSPGAVVGVPPGDHEALARSIVHLLADAGAMERRREALHLWARMHTMEWTVQQYAALYRELAAGR
jgi:glycosyltransferase involved in cell wall biosynthesis